MRFLLLCGSVLIAMVAAACTELPSAPDHDMLVLPAPSFSHWPVPGRCYSSQAAIDLHEDPEDPDPILTTHEEIAAAASADANGNGWVCLNLVGVGFGVFEFPSKGERTSFDDDFQTCGRDGYTVEFRGQDPADDNGNGFVCVSADGADVVDDNEDQASQEPGPIDVAECASGQAIEVSTDAQASVDENGNGWVCDVGTGIDGPLLEDDLAEAGSQGLTLTAGAVNGHGTYQVGPQTLSFSFHGRSDGESVKGNFEFHDRSAGIRFHGDVTCLETDGKTALLEGVAVAWTAVDNGEGKKAAADELAAPEAFGAWGGACEVRPTAPTASISGGNVQVR